MFSLNSYRQTLSLGRSLGLPPMLVVTRKNDAMEIRRVAPRVFNRS
jgi:hypothetical protein